jgi:beta-phosphoglucomutase-like phosphatase (HAD superfamily)
VENAPLGVEAARNAGMRCVAIETTLGKEYLTSADHVLQNIAELLSLPILTRDSI